MKTLSSETEMNYPVEIPSPDYFRRQVLCQQACPVGTDAGRYVSLIADGRFEEAYKVARRPNPFASICGRICAHPCEGSCRRGTIDSSLSIRALKRVLTEMYGPESMSKFDIASILEPPATRTLDPARVAIVGAGPAGLSCAHDLALLGHRPEVFEASPVAGGMLRLGVPEYRLPRGILGAEIRFIENLGVPIHLSTKVGRDVSFPDLVADYDAVFVGAGCSKGRSLDIPGIELDGVMLAVEFLLNVNLGFKAALGQHVVVVGGGNVAFDVARTATRVLFDAERDEPKHQMAMDVARLAMRGGAKRVTIVALESEDELPADLEELDEAHHEGIEVVHRRGPRAILGAAGRVQALQTVDVSRVFDDQGRFNPQFVEGSAREMPCDTVILAVGQSADLDFLGGDFGVQLNERGFVAVDTDTMETTRPGVFAGGDAAFGPRIAIQAVADGRQAALSIHGRHEGASLAEPVVAIETLALTSYRPAGGHDRDYDLTPRHEPPKLPTNRRIGQAEIEETFPLDLAQCEAGRCLRCWIAPVFDSSRCILCGGCADVCPELCLKLVPVGELDGDAFLQTLLQEIESVDDNLTAIIKDEEACTRCGLCAIRCPVDAITMEAFHQQTTSVTELQ